MFWKKKIKKKNLSKRQTRTQVFAGSFLSFFSFFKDTWYKEKEKETVSCWISKYETGNAFEKAKQDLVLVDSVTGTL